MSTNILVAYASVSGSTGEVAEVIGQVLEKSDAVVEVRPVKDVADIRGFDAVVLGSSIRAGRWLPEAVRFLDDHLEYLSQIPVAYFITCLTMVHDTEENRQTVLAYMEPILQQAQGINPVGLGMFAGSLDPHRASIVETRETVHGDYRDWDAIKAWADEITPTLLERAGSEDQVVLHGTLLHYADTVRSGPGGVDLEGADLREANLHGSNLQGANLSKTDLIRANLREADLNEARLHKAGLNWANLKQADMSGADLSRANLMGANLSHSNLKGANLSRAVLNGANLSRTDLSEANLSYADMNWINLSGADLSKADLSQASLGWADLSEANLREANLSHARYNDQTKWPEDFSAEAQGCIYFRIE